MNKIINFTTSLYTNNNQIFRSLALKFIANLYIKRNGETLSHSFIKAAGLISFELFNEFVLKEYEIVENDNLIYSSEIAVLGATLFPSYKMFATAFSFVASYTGFEYLNKNDVNTTLLTDNTFRFGIVSGSGFVGYKFGEIVSNQNTLATFSIAALASSISLYQVQNDDGCGYEFLNQILPLNEFYDVYKMLRFSNKTELDADINVLGRTVLFAKLAIGFAANDSVIKGSRLAQELLKVSDKEAFIAFLLSTGSYITFSLLPFAATYTTTTIISNNQLGEVLKKYSSEFTKYAGASGIVILDNSDLTLNQFNEKLCSAIININGDFKDFVSNIPDFILLSTALIKHAHVILPALYGLNQINQITSYVKDFLSKHILDQKKILDFITGRLTKLVEHDVKNSFVISSDKKLNKITAEKWVDIVKNSRDIETNLEIYKKIDSMFDYVAHNYVYSAQRAITQIFSGYLFYQKFIKGEEILLYSSAMHSAFGAWSYRLSKKSQLERLSDDVQIVDEFILKIEKKSIYLNNISFIKNEEDTLLHIEFLSYARGNDAKIINIKMNDIKFEKGHVYAITGGNGSGKSSFFDIIISQEHFLSDFGFKKFDGKINYSANEFVLINQNLYCPLYTIPFEWFIKMTKFELSNISKEKYDSLRDKILEYAKKFKLLYKDENNNLNNTLDTEQHDWYKEISGGEKIKVELIRQVFLHEKCPDVLLLDEILAPLDPATKSIMMIELKEFCNESTILTIYHNEKGCVDGGFFTDNLHFDGGEVQFRELCVNAE